MELNESRSVPFFIRCKMNARGQLPIRIKHTGLHGPVSCFSVRRYIQLVFTASNHLKSSVLMSRAGVIITINFKLYYDVFSVRTVLQFESYKWCGKLQEISNDLWQQPPQSIGYGLHNRTVETARFCWLTRSYDRAPLALLDPSWDNYISLKV